MVKSTDGYDVKVPSKGATDYAVVGGSLGIASFLGLNAGNILGNGCGGGLFGGGWNRNGGCSPADMPVTRYEMAMQHELASKDSKIALLESNIFTDQKITETYKELRGMISNLQEVAAQQAVTNTAFNSAMQSMDYKFTQAIALEAERRSCADCKIVNYVNSTFAPKLITDYTAGTTSAVAQVYNPLACGQCCGGGGNTFAGPNV
jgi:hypothetical protein